MTRTYAPIDIQTDGALPIRCFTSKELLPDPFAWRQLHQLAAVPGLQQYVVVLPDVHFKSRNPSPTGTVVVSHDTLVPRAIDRGINCGIRVIATPLAAGDLSPRLLDDLFGRLLQAIPYKRHTRPLLSDEACEQVLVHGLSKLVSLLDLPSDELARVENGGRMMPHLDPESIRAGLTPEVIRKAIRKGNRSLGTIGGGNHFLELQEIVKVFDQQSAQRLSLKQGHTVFMLHCDSRRLGKKILQPLREEAEQVYRTDGSSGELWTVPLDTELGQRYICGLAAASHAGFANRAAVTQILRHTIWEVFGDSSIQLSLVYDCGHETIQREQLVPDPVLSLVEGEVEGHDGNWFWVHRHGASRALPPSRLTHDPVLAEVGQPVPIPGSMGTDSYIAVTQPGVVRTFHSVAHGAGRVIAKDHAAREFDPDQVEVDLRNQRIRLYRYGVDNIAGQALASFKNAQQVLEVMTAFDLIRPVVRLRPIAVLKG